MILEEREHAWKRGARVLGEILGGGSGCDAMPAGGLDPEGSGTEVAITAALEMRDWHRHKSDMSTPTARRPRSPTWPRPAPSDGSSARGAFPSRP